VFNRFYRLEIHSLISHWLVFSTQLVKCCPRRNYTCVSLSSLWPPPPLPKLNVVQYIKTVCVWGGGEEEGVNCAIDHILQEFYTLFLTRLRTTPNKMASENDIKGLVSLKFLRPWHGLIDYIDTKAKCRHKKLTWKGTLR
jgi:hypothetical protein